MGRPRKIPQVEYVDSIDPIHDFAADPMTPTRRQAIARAIKTNEDCPLGKVYVSDNGHEVTVVAVDSQEVTFGFTRNLKGVEETRQRTVPRERLKFFLKAYK